MISEEQPTADAPLPADDTRLPPVATRRDVVKAAAVAGAAGLLGGTPGVLASGGIAPGNPAPRDPVRGLGRRLAAERPTATAASGMVAAPHRLASEAGLQVLKDGGTALDAAVAANAVLTVLYPDQTSIGGDCFLLYHEATTRKLHGLNGSGRAPRGADRAALRALGYDTMPSRGIFAVTVPGTIDAWDRALTRFGRFGLDRLLQPAIGYARDGFPVSSLVAADIAAVSDVLASSEATSTAFLPGGQIPSAGDRLRLPDLAASLDLIARQGREVFYRGTIAERIAATSTRLGGWLNLDDLAAHHGDWVEPVRSDYRGLTVVEMPPNSQGLTAQVGLNLVEQVTLPSDWGDAEHLHPLIEAKKLAFAVRDRHLSDPAFVKIDTAHLTSKAYARELWRSYDPNQAMASPPARTGDTVFVCAVDRDGNAASLIQSIYMAFGSGVIADGTGIVLQNRGAYFALDDDSVNRLEPGKRTLHTLMPAMLYRDGHLLGPLGTQGGDAQAQLQLQLITDLVDYGMEPQQAVDAPRWLAGGADSTDVVLEGRFPAATFDGLGALGHAVSATADYDPGFGHAQVILRDPDRGLLKGAADPRADGAALGY